MIPSRFQAAQGPYGPLLTAGLYPPATPRAAATPTAPSTVGGVSAAAPAPAASTAAQDAPTPVSSGATQVDGGANNDPSNPNDNISPNQSFGGVMDALGAAASIGLGGLPGFAGAMGALSLSSTMGVPSFSMQTALEDLAQTAFGRTADVTAGMGGPEGTGAAVSSWGLADAPEGGKGGSPDGGMKGEEGGKPGASTDTGPPGGDAKGGETGSPGAHGGESDGVGEGWMKGGYTGHGDDGVMQPHRKVDGPVHEGEHVTNAKATAYYGLGLLGALNDMRIPRSLLAELARGYK